MQDYDGTFELIDPKLIVLDHKYQRPEKWDLIAKISSAPEWAAFGVVLCSRRTVGKGEYLYYALDGQQRLMGVLASSAPPTRVPAIWFSVTNVKEEARLFSIVNEQRKSVNSLEKYKSHITQEDPRYVQVASAVERAGFTVGASAGEPRSVGSVQGLLEIYNSAGEDGVYLILSAISEAWSNESGATATFILRALGDILGEARSNGGMTSTKLAGALAKTTPGRVLRKAEELRFEMGGSKRANVRRAFKALVKL